MRTFQLSKQVYIKSGFTIVGPKEGDGNFADKFDIVLKNDIWCEKSFEKMRKQDASRRRERSYKESRVKA